MISGTYRFQLAFGKVFPDPVVKPGVENEKLGPTPPRLKVEDRPTIYHTVEFFEEDGVIKAIHQTELGKQKVDKVTYDNHTISWCAYSGSEGVDLWYYSMACNEGTDQFAGVASGATPFFRGYILFYGEKIKNEEAH